MTNREQLKHRVLELIWDMPYKKAIKKEFVWDYWNDEEDVRRYNPITLSRVMEALGSEYVCTGFGDIMKLYDSEYGDVVDYNKSIDWKLLNDRKQTATDDNQTEKTINELLKLLK